MKQNNQISNQQNQHNIAEMQPQSPLEKQPQLPKNLMSDEQQEMDKRSWQQQQQTVAQFNQNIDQKLKMGQNKFENPFLHQSEIAQKVELKERTTIAVNQDRKIEQEGNVTEQMDTSKEYSSIFAKKQDISLNTSTDHAEIQTDDRIVSGTQQSNLTDQGLKSRNDIIFREVVLEIEQDPQKNKPNQQQAKYQNQKGDSKNEGFQNSIFVDVNQHQSAINAQSTAKVEYISKGADKSDSQLLVNCSTQQKHRESSGSMKVIGVPSPTQKIEIDTVDPVQQNTRIEKIYKDEKKNPEAYDLNLLKQNHIKELKKRKKLLAKDDSNRVELRKSMEGHNKHRENLMLDSASDFFVGKIGSDILKQNQFLKSYKANHRESQPSRARKMSETPPKRNRQNELKNNLIAEEDIDELEVNHSLQVLQAHLRNQQVGSPPRKQNTQDPLISPYERYRYKDGYKNLNLKAMSLIGADSQHRILNPKDSIFRKLSNFGSNGYDGVEGQSDHEVIERPDITKAQKPAQSDKEDDDEDDDNDLVSLDDNSLDKVPSFNYDSGLSFNMLERNLQKAIDQAENMTSHQIETQPLLPEEYESLVFGQSIWSTEVQKESKMQFMAHLQQMQSSDMYNPNSSDTNKKQTKENHESDPENEFDILQKKIQQETLRQRGSPSPDPTQLQKPIESNLGNDLGQNQNRITENMKDFNQDSLNDQIEKQPAGSSQFIAAPQQKLLQNDQQQLPPGAVDQQQQHNSNSNYPGMTQYTTNSQVNASNQQQQPNSQGTPNQFQDNQQQNLYHSQQQHQPQQFSQSQAAQQQNQFDIAPQGTTGSQPVTDLGPTQPNYPQETADFANQYQQQQQDYTNASVGVNIPSVHSGQVAFQAHAGSGSAVGIFEVGAEFPGDQSSNYCPSTHHPFSMIGDPNQQNHPQQHPQYMQANNFGGHNNQNQNGNGQQHHTQLNNHQWKHNSKYHIKINRLVSRYMMGPIFKSKNPQNVMMHRFSGIPWRGTHHQINAAQIITPHGPGGYMDNMEHGHMSMQHQGMNPQGYHNAAQMSTAQTGGTNQLIQKIQQPGQNQTIPQQQIPQSPHLQQHLCNQADQRQEQQQLTSTSQGQQHVQSQQAPSFNGLSSTSNPQQMSFQQMQAIQDMQQLTKDQLQVQSDLNQVQQQNAANSPPQQFSGANQGQSQQLKEQQYQLMGQQDQSTIEKQMQSTVNAAAGIIQGYQSSMGQQNDQNSQTLQNQQQQIQNASRLIDESGHQQHPMQSALIAEPFYPTGYTEQKTQMQDQYQSMHAPGLQPQNQHQQQQNSLNLMINSQLPPQPQNQSANPQGKKLGNLLNQRPPARAIKQPAIQVLPIPIFGLNNKAHQKHHQKHGQIMHYPGQGEKNRDDNAKVEHAEYPNGMKQSEQQYRQQIFSTFYDSSILSKKIELDQKMKMTTEKLGQKIIKAKEINEDDDEDDQEEDDITFDMLSTHDNQQEHLSVERSDSVLNKSINIKDISQHLSKVKINLKNLKPETNENKDAPDQQAVSGLTKQEEKIKQYEDKVKRRNQRAAIFKKLQEQLEQFKNEMFEKQELTTTSTSNTVHNNSSSISPKRSKKLIKGDQTSKELAQQIDQKTKEGSTFPNQPRLTPFRQDAKQYLDKVLDLMNMINEVDDVTNVADLKNKIERYRIFILKARAERDYQSHLVAKLQQQMQSQTFIHNEFKEKELKYQSQISDNQSVIQTLNQNIQNMTEQNDHNCQVIAQQMQQMEQLRQENHDLMMQNSQLQKNFEDHAQIQSHQLNQISTLTQQNESLQSNVYSQLNQIQQLQQQNEQLNQNHYQVQQNLNQQQLDNQMIKAKLDKMEGDRTVLETKLKEYQQNLITGKSEDTSQPHEDIMNQRSSKRRSYKGQRDSQQIEVRNEEAQKTSPRNKKGQSEEQAQELVDFNSEDSNEVPLEIQLQNANQQVRDLQEYIKKRRLNDHQNKQGNLQQSSNNEKELQQKYNKLRKQFEEMEREKDKIIHRLKDFIKNHNESILIGSLGSSMVGTGNIVYSSNVGGSDSRSERSQTANTGIQNQVDDQSTIEARSMIDNSIDNNENEDIVRAIMNDYTCEKCEEKEKMIQNNEQRISDYIAYIQKQSFQRQNLLQNQREMSSLAIQPNPVENFATKINSSTQTQPPEFQTAVSSSAQASLSQLKIENQNSVQNNSNTSSGGAQIGQGTSNSNGSLLKASHQLLLNNFIRQVKVYLDNVEEQESEPIEKMKSKLDLVANSQRITLFDEDEQPDTDLITPTLIQQITSMSLDLVNDLLQAASKATSDSLMLEQSQPQIIEKIVERVTVQFKTIEFGLTSQELKDMQKLARDERKACHHIIVEIEKLMYEMNTFMSAPQEQFNQADSGKVFTQILDTYLSLPHRLKPIFDHCKKIESVMQKAMKSQDEVLKKAQQQQQQ